MISSREEEDDEDGLRLLCSTLFNCKCTNSQNQLKTQIWTQIPAGHLTSILSKIKRYKTKTPQKLQAQIEISNIEHWIAKNLRSSQRHGYFLECRKWRASPHGGRANDSIIYKCKNSPEGFQNQWWLALMCWHRNQTLVPADRMASGQSSGPELS